jgi:uncharacterized protein (DUF302 family)
MTAGSVQSFEAVTVRSFADTEAMVREALARHGFGVITEIDVSATLAAKLGVVRPPLKILGACNPQFAHRALELDASVSLLLPCNVVVEAVGTATRVRAVDPRHLLDDPRFAVLADEAARALADAIAELDGSQA